MYKYIWNRYTFLILILLLIALCLLSGCQFNSDADRHIVIMNTYTGETLYEYSGRFMIDEAAGELTVYPDDGDKFYIRYKNDAIIYSITNISENK